MLGNKFQSLDSTASYKTLGDPFSREEGDPSRVGVLEKISGAHLVGWAVDYDGHSRPVDLMLWVNGVAVEKFTTHTGREDLASIWGEENRLGFSLFVGDLLDRSVRLFRKERDEGMKPLSCPVTFAVSIGHEVTDSEEALFLQGSPATANPVGFRADFVDYCGDFIGNLDNLRGNVLSGWIQYLGDPASPRHLRFLIDGVVAGQTMANLSRPDVEERTGSSSLGFEWTIPPELASVNRLCAITVQDIGTEEALFEPVLIRLMQDDGVHLLANINQGIAALAHQLDPLKRKLEEDGIGATTETRYTLAGYHGYFEKVYEFKEAEVEAQRVEAAQLGYRPLISVLLPTYNTPPHFLQEAVQSIFDQTYDHWELCIADDNSSDDATRQVLAEIVKSDPRIRIVYGDENLNISLNTQRCVDMAEGAYMALFDHDDTLTVDALFEMVKAIQDERHPILYSDEDHIDPSGNLTIPNFKPDWNYDYLLAINYVCHFMMIDSEVMRQAGGFREGVDGCQDRDVLLRCYEVVGDEGIHHIPRVLYHWRINHGSMSQSASNTKKLMERGRKVVQEHLDRTGRKGTAIAEDDQAFTTRVLWDVPDPAPKVSIIVPTKDALSYLEPCVRSVLELTDYSDFEVIIVDHESQHLSTTEFFDTVTTEDERVRVHSYSGSFNYSAINNSAVEVADGEILIFLNNDTAVIDKDWLRHLVSQASRPGVGAVGAKLLYEDDTVQHAGVVLGIGGIAGHAHHGVPKDDRGFMERASVHQNVSCVTAACLAMREEVFEEVGRFNAIDLQVAFNDVDLCMRVAEAGYRLVWDPEVVLYHYESKSRGSDTFGDKARRFAREAKYMRSKWGKKLLHDPHFNPHFSLNASPYHAIVDPKHNLSS